jgi:hypothetical protein
MCNNEYNTCLMQGTQFYRKFTIDEEGFSFDDYLVRMEIRNTTPIFLEDTDFIKTDKTIEFNIGASVTRTFNLGFINYGIELIDKNNSERVISFLTGTLEVCDEIPKEV